MYSGTISMHEGKNDTHNSASLLSSTSASPKLLAGLVQCMLRLHEVTRYPVVFDNAVTCPSLLILRKHWQLLL
jgi:hypothetical protein